MSKVVLVDFDEKDRERLRAEGIDAELLAAGPGEPARPGVPPDLETLFFQMGRPGQEGRARNGIASEIAPLVGPLVPDADVVLVQVGDVGVTA